MFDNKGFTLHELIVALALLSLILLIAYGLLSVNIKSLTSGTMGFIDRTRYLDTLYNMMRDIQSSQKVVIRNNKVLELTYYDGSVHTYSINDNSLFYDSLELLTIDGENSMFKLGSYVDSSGSEELVSSVDIIICFEKRKDIRGRQFALDTTVNVRNGSVVEVINDA